MKKGWQAFDCLDEDWCPIVQLHGIFTDISTGGGPLYPGACASGVRRARKEKTLTRCVCVHSLTV